MKGMIFLSSLCITGICILSVIAQPRHGGTPPFVSACSTMNVGDACTFTERDGSEITGTCREMKNPRTDKDELVCWNEDSMKRMGPPPVRGNPR